MKGLRKIKEIYLKLTATPASISIPTKCHAPYRSAYLLPSQQHVKRTLKSHGIRRCVDWQVGSDVSKACTVFTCRSFLEMFGPDDEGSTLPRNVGNYYRHGVDIPEGKPASALLWRSLSRIVNSLTVLTTLCATSVWCSSALSFVDRAYYWVFVASLNIHTPVTNWSGISKCAVTGKLWCPLECDTV